MAHDLNVFLQYPIGGLCLFRFSDDLELTRASVGTTSVAIAMLSQAGGQEGYFSNFDWDTGDDFKPVSSVFHTPVRFYLGPANSSMLLFDTNSWYMGSRTERQPDLIDQAV